MADVGEACCGACCVASEANCLYYLTLKPYGADCSSCDQCCRCNCCWDAGEYAPDDEEEDDRARSKNQQQNGVDNAGAQVGGTDETPRAPPPAYQATPPMSIPATAEVGGTAEGAAPNLEGATNAQEARADATRA